jgi:hypothetical protein
MRRRSISPLPRRGVSLRVVVLNNLRRDNSFKKEARIGRYNIKGVIRRIVFPYFELYYSTYQIDTHIAISTNLY